MKTTNYKNIFIAVAEDCKATFAKVPALRKSGKTLANIQFDMIFANPYHYTSDDVIYEAYRFKNGSEALSKEEYFSTGKACLRTSPLAKTYGWGIHSNTDCKVALYGIHSEVYKQFISDKNINQRTAMRSKRA